MCKNSCYSSSFCNFISVNNFLTVTILLQNVMNPSCMCMGYFCVLGAASIFHPKLCFEKGFEKGAVVVGPICIINFETTLQCLLISLSLVPSSCVHWHTKDVLAKRVLLSQFLILVLRNVRMSEKLNVDGLPRKLRFIFWMG